MCEPNVMTISTSCQPSGTGVKVRHINKAIRIHHLGTVNGCPTNQYLRP